MLKTVLLPPLMMTATLLLACSSEEPPPPTRVTGPIFGDTFDDAAPLPREWDAARGEMAIVDGAPNGGRMLQARAVPPRRDEAGLKKSMSATGAKVLTCRLAAMLSKTGGNTPQTVARIDVLGGAVLVDLQPSSWRIFGKFPGTLDFAESGERDLLNRWSNIVLRIENTGRIVMRFEGDERVKIVDIKAAPIDVAKSSIELGLFAPPPAVDSESSFDDVSCETE